MSFDDQIDALPPLPDYTDIEVERTEAGVRFTLRPRKWRRLRGWFFSAGFVVMIGAMTIGAAATAKYDSLSWAVIGCVALTLFCIFVGGILLAVGHIVNSLQATIQIDEHTMTVREKALGTNLEHHFDRAQVRSLRTGPTGKVGLDLDFARDTSRRLRFERRHRQMQLEIQTDDHEAMGLVRDWYEDDLDWIAQAVAHLWDLPCHVRYDPDLIVQSTSLVEVHQRQSRAQLRHPAFIGFVLVGAILMTALGLWGTPKALASQRWPIVSGEVLHARHIITDRGSKGDEAEMTYTYEVEQERYESDCISFSRVATDQVVRDFAKSHPKGTTVSVYYNPSDPSQSVLIPGVSWWRWMMLGCGVSLAIMAIWLLLTRGRYQAPATNMG